MNKTYHNLDELLNGETPCSFGKGLYRATGCGQWTAFIVTVEPDKTESFDLVIGCDGKDNRATLFGGNPPAEVLQILALDGNKERKSYEWDWKTYCKNLDTFVLKHAGKPVNVSNGKTVTLSLAKKSIARRWIRATVSTEEINENVGYEDGKDFDHSRCKGIKIGSIVEGSDVDVEPRELIFPFTDKDMYEAVKGVDSEASFYWERDNCEPCKVCEETGRPECYLDGKKGHGMKEGKLHYWVKRAIAAENSAQSAGEYNLFVSETVEDLKEVVSDLLAVIKHKCDAFSVDDPVSDVLRRANVAIGLRKEYHINKNRAYAERDGLGL